MVIPGLQVNPADLGAVVFDFDGVILETDDIKTQAFAQLFVDHPEHREAILDLHRENMGLSRLIKFERIHAQILGKPLSPKEKDRLADRFAELVLDRVLASAEVPGMRACLEVLLSRLPMFVASGTPQKELDLVVARRDLAGYFTEVWGSPPSKPDIIRGIMTRWSLTPGQVLMVGDGESDWRAAQETGIHFVARAYAHTAARWQRDQVPALTDLRGLAAWLGGGRGA